MTTLKIADIRIDGGTQSRVEIDTDVMSEYADAIHAGVKMPPVTVFFDGADHWLADGFHRLLAHLDRYLEEIEADVITGTVIDAKLHAYAANKNHGLRRSNADKRKAVEGMLAIASEWSDRQIAAHVGVSVPFVGAVRRPEVAARQQENRDKTSASNGAESVIGLQSDPEKEIDQKSDFIHTSQETASVMKSQPAVAPTIRNQQRAATVEQREILEGSAPVAAKPSLRVDAVEDSSPENNSEQADLDAYVASLQRTVEELRRENASLAATDRDGEIQKLSRQVLHLENRVVDLSEKNGAQRRQLDWFGAKFNDLRKLTGAKMDRDVVGLVRKLVEAGE